MAEATKVTSKGSAVLKKGEYGFPLGHLGHLSDAQQTALVEFKEICAESGLYKPAVDGKPSSHDDATLLRFLRARRFVPKDAFQQFKDTERWRQVNELENLYNNIDVDNYDEARKLYPQWSGRRDKRGIPVYIFEVKPLDSKTMAAYAKSTVSTSVVGSKDTKPKKDKKINDGDSATPPRLLRLFALYENLSGFMTTLCSALHDRPYPDTPITQSNNIVDISGVGLKQFWNLRSHMQDASLLATAHYPETLDRIFIVGAPSFFPQVWSWIKRWFDPITVSKIFILSDQTAFPTLSKFIDPANIPKKYGGTLDFTFGNLPSVDPSYAEKLVWKDGKQDPKRTWPRGPHKWIKREDGNMDLLLVGSEGEKERRKVVATLMLDAPDAKLGQVDGAGETAGAIDGPPAHSSPLQNEQHSESAGKEAALLHENGEVSAAAAAVTTATPGPAGEAALKALSLDDKPVGPAVEPVPLAAVATKLPEDKGEQAVLTNGSA